MRVNTTVVFGDDIVNDTIAPDVSDGLVTPRHTLPLHVGSPIPRLSLANCFTAPVLTFTRWIVGSPEADW